MGLRVVLTGASGFVGSHLRTALVAHPAVDRVDAWCRRPRPGMVAVDLRDRSATARALRSARPDVVVHLAAVAGDHSHAPALVDAVNLRGVDGILDQLGEARLVLASTGYVYGPTTRPAVESQPLAPIGAYAESKARLEETLRARLPPTQLRILRPFNHSGPGQPAGYALPDLARAVWAHCADPSRPLRTGALGAVRDIGDVRDLARAFVLAATAPTWPTLCNVCTGVGRSMESVLRSLLRLAGARVPTHLNRALASGSAPLALPRCVGDPRRLHATGFRHRHSLEQTLQAVLSEAGPADAVGSSP